MARPWRCDLVLPLVLLTWLAGPSPAPCDEVTTFVIEKVLDDPALIDFKNVTLEEAFRRLKTSTGVAFDMEGAAPALGQLPHGHLTHISAQFQGMSWRVALRELLKPLALVFQAGEDRIYILGTKELMRQPRRLRLEELEALVVLQNVELDSSEYDLLKQLNEVTAKYFAGQNVRFNFGVILHGRRLQRIDTQDARNVLSSVPQPAARVLDEYSRMRQLRSAPGTWYLQGRLDEEGTYQIDIHILTVDELIAMKLNRRIKLEYYGMPVQEILHDLAQKATVAIRFEPGCISLVDETQRENCTLVMQGGTIKKALEALVGTTSLAYSYDADGLEIRASEALKAREGFRALAAQGSDPVIGVQTVTLPGGMEIRKPIRESDLKQEGLLETYRRVQQDQWYEFLQYLRDFQVVEN